MLERCFRLLQSIATWPDSHKQFGIPAWVAHAMFRKKSTGPVNRQHQVEIVWSEHARDMTRADGFANSSDGISFYWHIVMKTGISGGIGETVNGSCRLRILLCSRHPQAARDIPRRQLVAGRAPASIAKRRLWHFVLLRPECGWARQTK
jgi:hypothetical protein